MAESSSVVAEPICLDRDHVRLMTDSVHFEKRGLFGVVSKIIEGLSGDAEASLGRLSLELSA